jgi:hypothetical protein
MPLIDRIEVEAVWTDPKSRFDNTTGTLLVSAGPSDTGEAIPDLYTLVITGVGGGNGDVTVQTASDSNPYKGRVVTDVPLDSATEVFNVIPGMSLVFSSSAAESDAAEVEFGTAWGTFNSFGVTAGDPSEGIRHQVENDSTVAVSDAVAKLLTQAVLVKKTGSALSYVGPFAENAVEKVDGDRTMPYALKTVNVSGSGSGKTADLQVDGVTLGATTVREISTGEEMDGTGLKAVSPNHYYEIISGPLDGLVFAIHASCANNNVGNVLIFPSRNIQIAPDVAGVEGTYGTADVDLTETDESTGVITAGGFAYFWMRVLVPPGAPSESNPHPGNVCVQGIETSEAGWLE